ncbi:MAG TPA: gliding motility-associated C-terminal domain-containing protein, partial [Chitinophagaceae bacterium]|nr:gliding motility-associated C-terminal domain-containing protein [Chitinophagaceae bacterium]
TQQINNATAIEQSGVYYIRGTDKNGCSVIEPVKVIISSIVAMPSAFSPNADGKNDVLRLIAKGGIRQLSYFKIFDRWGHLVFSTNNAGSGWDGTFNGKAADTGTYVWMIRATDYAGTVFEKKGTVVLVR